MYTPSVFHSLGWADSANKVVLVSKDGVQALDRALLLLCCG